ncbi:hypothetical protein C0J52_03187 [Blattella germanica]|nr:hypothetical protein C0J52_03187 [Blattella germanica]
MLKVQLCPPRMENCFPCAVPGEIMQTEADLPVPEETSSLTLLQEEEEEEMTVKEEEEEEEEDQEASTGGVEPGSREFSPMTSPTGAVSPPVEASPQGQEELERQNKGGEKGRGGGAGRGRRRSRWKLKFHHQALPPEYLDHYEASIANKPSTKPDSRVKSSSTLGSRNQSVDKIASGGRSASEKTCLPPIKIEPDGGHTMHFAPSLQGQAPLILNTPVEQLRLIPFQTLGISGSDGHNADDEISIINERKAVHALNGDKCVQQGKGLLGCLLANSQQTMSKSDNSKRRSSVIMSAPPTTSKVMKYQDLPYMGEITLDNMKPRRGRKPKKADICHLIYKNYGTIFPGTPNSASLTEAEEQNSNKRREAKTKSEGLSPTGSGIKCRAIESLRGGSAPINHADVQNRIISSLLEKRLTAASQQEANRKSFFSTLQDFNLSGAWNKRTLPVPPASASPSPSAPSTPTCSDEPLNLCVKDLNQLKIRLLRKHGNFYEPRTSSTVTNSVAKPISVKSEPTNNSSSSDMEELLEVSDDSPKFPSTPDESRNQTPFPQTIAGLTFPTPPDFQAPGGYVYWPGAGVFVHPMALQSQLLYYQKMGAIPLVSTEQPIAANPTTFTPLPLPQQINVAKPPTKAASSSPKNPVPKAFSNVMNPPAPGKPCGVMPSELTFPRMKRLAPLGNPPPAAGSTGTKRKRSAIFIPPMPSENNANPTTEVSICKFKFTGGAKPSLQEKKMLSVDSGGNFRYYSGTGDKSMRGYEFFPRESLQQPAGATGGSSSEHFLAAASAMTNGALHPGFSLDGAPSSDVNRSPLLDSSRQSSDGRPSYYDEQGVKKKCGGSSDRLECEGSDHSQLESGPQHFRLQRRKRKTRKSLAREKLEQTFKEKGFLIQTQQLESAEGATYCKFRQLRKFTRYLFRSWKDYLPGNVREMSVAAGVSGPGEESPPPPGDSELEGELSSNPPTPTSTTPQTTYVDDSPQQPPSA